MRSFRNPIHAVRMLATVVAVLFAALAACNDAGHSESQDATVFDAKPIDYSQHSGRCLVSADCPPGAYCDLGVCRTDCDQENPCSTGDECSGHGRCLLAGQPDRDPPPTNEIQDELQVTPEAVFLTRDVTEAELQVKSKGGTPFKFRVETGADYVQTDRSEAQQADGPVAVNVSIDRSQLPSSSGGVLLRVVSDIGTTVVPLHIEEGLGGRYVGELVFTGPHLEAKVPLMLDLNEVGSDIFARIAAEGSPTFSSDTVGCAELNVDELTVTVGTLAHRQPGSGWRGDFFLRPISRQVALQLNVTQTNVITGTYTETITGMFAAPFTVSGTVSLRRLGGEESFGSFLVYDVPQVPNATTTIPPVTPECAQQVACGNPSDPATCPSEAEKLQTAMSIRENAAQLYSTFPSEGWSQTMVEDCQNELNGSLDPGQTGACLNTHDNSCALLLFEEYISNGGTNSLAYEGQLAALGDLIVAWSFLGNSEVVEAFRSRFLPQGGMDQELTSLSTALDHYTSGEREIYRPWRLKALGTIPTSAFQNSDYELFRKAFNVVTRVQTALTREARLKIRKNTSQSHEVKADVQAAAETTFLRVAALGEVFRQVSESDPNPPAIPEHRAAGQSVTELALLFIQVGPQRNPLGFSPTYVPFEYRVGDTALTNFEQIHGRVTAPNGPVQLAMDAEAQALQTTRSWENNQQELGDQLTNLEIRYNEQLADICGEKPNGEPDIENCGETSGQLRVELDNVAVERLGVEVSAKRIENLADQVQIEMDRANAVAGVRENSIKLILETGEAFAANSIMDSILAGTQQFLAIAANAQAWNAGAPIGMGIAAMALQIERGLLAGERDRLQALQGARMETATQQIELINSAATVKNLLLQSTTLAIESQMQFLRMSQAMTRASNLRAKVDRLLADREVLRRRIQNNPINDPSYRVIRDEISFKAEAYFETALKEVYLAARAFEYETNTHYPFIESQLYSIRKAEDLRAFMTCLNTNFAQFIQVYGAPQEYVEEVSVREDILGITQDIQDSVTDETVTPQEQFRRVLLASSNLDGRGGVSLEFSTSVLEGNGVFSALVCNDRIKNVGVMFVGDFLGDNQARVAITQSGASVIRSCEAHQGGADDVLVEYNIDPDTQIVQAGVNDYGIAQPNTGFYGRSVAFATWTLWIPGADDEPTNADLDLTHLDDIVLRITHQAISLNEASPQDYTPVCP